MRRLINVFVCLSSLILLCGVLFSYMEFPDPCANEIISEKPSPNGKLKAVIFIRDCGATTAYSRQVSIIPATEKLPNESGNVFIAGAEPTLDVRWNDDKNLTITGGGDHSPFPIAGFPGVHVTYH